MANDDLIRGGTASVANGSKAVTGQNVSWTRVLSGDFFGAHIGLAIPIEAISGTSITLAYAWPGPSQTGAPYAIQQKGDVTRFQERIRLLVEGLSTIDAAVAAAAAEAIEDLIGAAPDLLNSLADLAAAIGNDPNFAATMLTALNLRLRVDVEQNLTPTQKARGKSNLGLDKVQNLTPAEMPVSTLQAAAISSAVASIVASSPAALDTLKELATALGNDPNFASTILTLVGTIRDEVVAGRGTSTSLAARIAAVLQAASDGIAAEAAFRQSSDNTLTQGVNLVTSEVVAARGTSSSLAARIAAVLQAAADAVANEATLRQSSDNTLTTAQNLILERLDRVADRQVIGIAETPVTGTTATDQTFVLPQPVTRDGYLGGLFLFAKAAGVVKVRRYKKTGDNFISVSQDYLVPVSLGLNLSTVDNLGTIPVFAGDYLGIYGSGILCYLLGANSGFYGAAGDQPSFADNTIDTSAKLQVQFVVNAGAAPAARGFVSDAVSGSIQTIGIRKAGVTGDSLPRNTWVFSESVARDSKLSALRAYAHSEIVVKLKRFVKAGNSFNQVGKDYPVRLLGGPNILIEDEVGAMALKAGEYIGFSNDGAGSDLAFLVGAGVEAGYFTPLVDGTNTTFLTDTTADYGARIQIGFDLKADPMKLAQLPASAPLALEETILDASISAVVASGLVITCRALVGRSGMGLWTPSQTIALAATASTNIRFDLLYYDVSTKQLGIIQGTERAGDPDAFMPKRTSLRQLPIAMLRVYQATVQWTMLYELVDGVMPQAKAWRDQIRSENRRRAKPLTARAASRQAIKLISFGDSINAQQSAVPSSTAPNGAMRDRATAVYLAEGYGSDVLATIQLYTAVQLGRADDGAGAVHTRVGMVWEVVSALEKQGYVLGQDLVYDNWSVAGSSSADAVSGSTPTSSLTSAAASGAHGVLVTYGMNELGDPAAEARLMIAGQTFLSAGSLPIFVGVPRPRTLAIHNWAFTNRLIKRVADALDVPFVPVDHLYDDRFIAALGGLTTLDVCPSNKINHPGLIELPAIGREIVANLHLGTDVVGLGAMSGSTLIGRSLLRSASQSAARTALGLAPVASSGSAADLTGTIPDAQLPDRLRSTIVSVTNWDLAIEPGFYTGLDTALNSPVAQFCFGIVKARGTAHCEQILTEIGGTLTDSKTYRRTRSNSGAFSVWQRVRQTEEELNALYARLSAAVFTGPPQLPPYTVATLPAASATPRGKAWASNGRAFTGLGMQEASGAGTGVEVISNGSAWKISGTNVTVSA
ncbi:pyocin knob domain-containing protein [Rhizobium sp. 9140]|uniref:pyocin knob domain-containing protein n=1 Tax=Rhizobium sp. 9140 TaxID=1761900 RepID=UPI00079891E5|nr:pyocin knob domain-containing protein [Rhizobium sp. 9140]CZT36243.1 hypothetical protein GA0004734_00032430 [Rhizobium sp. 9140]